MSRRQNRIVPPFAALIVGLAAFTPPAAMAQTTEAAYALANRLGSAMKRCWFMGGDPMFGDYVAAAEPNATGGPRILVVQRNAPDGRPALVVEILGGGAKPKVNVYGPLATDAAGDRIARDLRRWLDGGDGCG